jgi:hypothetical protein
MMPSLNKWSRPAIRKPWVLLSCVALLLGISTTFTRATVRPYSMPGNLLQYFQNKYSQVDDSLEVRIQPTADGPLGQLDISGAIAMSVDVTGMSTEDAARAVAMAFLTAEADLLDIPNPGDMHETSLLVDAEDGLTVVQYSRYIGQVPFVDVNISVVVNENHAITHVEATLAPMSTAMASAVGQSTLTSSDVSTIVHNDLVRSNQPVEPTLSQPVLAATWRPPYVVWGLSGSVGDKPAWGYSIDAFTGEILNKSCTANTVRETPGGTPCD